MGRLVRRFIRAHQITVTNKLEVAKNIAIDNTGTVLGVSSVIEVPAGVTQSGYLRGLNSEINVNAGSEVDNYLSAIHMSMYADATATLAQVSCIYLSNYICVQPTYRYTFLDMRDNGPGITVGCFAYVRVASDIENLFVLHSNTTAWTLALNPPNGIVTANGRIAVNVGGVQRYIALFD